MKLILKNSQLQFSKASDKTVRITEALANASTGVTYGTREISESSYYHLQITVKDGETFTATAKIYPSPSLCMFYMFRKNESNSFDSKYPEGESTQLYTLSYTNNTGADIDVYVNYNPDVTPILELA